MIVSNTTPLSNFLLLHRMDILKGLFSTLHIPHAVKDEIEAFFLGNEEWEMCLKEGVIVVHPVHNASLLDRFLRMLHPGEAEAFCLYTESHAQLCLVDDKDACAFASWNNIKTSGTLGILIQAKQKGLIDSVKPLVDTLRDQHYFWISHPMYQRVLQLAHED